MEAVGGLYSAVERRATDLGLVPDQAVKRSQGDRYAFLHYRFPERIDGNPVPLTRNDVRVAGRHQGTNLQYLVHRRIGGSRYSSFALWDAATRELTLQKFDTTVPLDSIQARQRSHFVQAVYGVKVLEQGGMSVYLKEVTVLRTYPGPQTGIVAAINGTSVASWQPRGRFVGEVAKTLVEEGDDLLLKVTSDSFGTRARAAGEQAMEVGVRVPKPASLLRGGLLDLGLAAEAAAERLRFAPFIDWGKQLLAGSLKTATVAAPAVLLVGLIGVAAYYRRRHQAVDVTA